VIGPHRVVGGWNPSGDVVVGDSDGVVVIPRDRAAETLEAARRRMGMEAAWHERVTQGADTADLLGLSDLADRYGIEIE